MVESEEFGRESSGKPFRWTKDGIFYCLQLTGGFIFVFLSAIKWGKCSDLPSLHYYLFFLGLVGGLFAVNGLVFRVPLDSPTAKLRCSYALINLLLYFLFFGVVVWGAVITWGKVIKYWSGTENCESLMYQMSFLTSVVALPLLVIQNLLLISTIILQRFFYSQDDRLSAEEQKLLQA